jgi:hypothetical protein
MRVKITRGDAGRCERRSPLLDGYDVIDESTALAPTLDEPKAAFRAVCI